MLCGHERVVFAGVENGVLEPGRAGRGGFVDHERRRGVTRRHGVRGGRERVATVRGPGAGTRSLPGTRVRVEAFAELAAVGVLLETLLLGAPILEPDLKRRAKANVRGDLIHVGSKVRLCRSL